MSVWLVTGATGFVGRHVLAELKARDAEAPSRDDRILVLGRRRPAECSASDFVAADLNDTTQLISAIEQVTPDYVIHTAGRTPPALDDELYRANFWGTLHLLKALRTLGKATRVVLSGSAAELGPVDQAKLPVSEAYPCDPITAYGRSKWMATVAGLSERAPLDVMVARVFNPVGPGTPESQALGRFAGRLSEPGSDPLELLAGDLDACRDFIDVRDVAAAMIAVALRGEPGEVYHVGTGCSHRVGDGLDILARLSGRTVRARLDSTLLKNRGPADSRADIARITSQTGWQPRISWEQSLTDLWNAACGQRGSQAWPQVAAA
jgi:GDP-4-dehydro-6-deoxy-D-mannose reductase